jgi:hypothetical protein
MPVILKKGKGIKRQKDGWGSPDYFQVPFSQFHYADDFSTT